MDENIKCEVCEWPSQMKIFVRPQKGGRRTPHFFCDDDCKASGLRVLEAQGLKEDSALRGWDVFRPIFDDE